MQWRSAIMQWRAVISQNNAFALPKIVLDLNRSLVAVKRCLNNNKTDFYSAVVSYDTEALMIHESVSNCSCNHSIKRTVCVYVVSCMVYTSTKCIWHAYFVAWSQWQSDIRWTWIVISISKPGISQPQQQPTEGRQQSGSFSMCFSLSVILLQLLLCIYNAFSFAVTYFFSEVSEVQKLELVLLASSIVFTWWRWNMFMVP